MAQPDRHDALALRARLEFPVWHRVFIKSYTAWSNAPSDLKGPMLLSGQGLARAETWLIEYPSKLTDSQKRFIVRSIAQRAKLPASTPDDPVAKTSSRWQWRRSSDRPLWQVFAVIAFGCWVFLPDVMSDLLERALNSPEAYDIARQQQKTPPSPAPGPPNPNLASLDDAPEAAAAAAELPPLLQDISTKPAEPPAPPPLNHTERLAALALDKLHADQGRIGLLVAIELAETDPQIASAADAPPPPALVLATATRETLAPLALQTATSKAALFCNDTRGVVALTEPGELTAWHGERSTPRKLGGITMRDLASAAVDPECRRTLVSNDDFNIEIRSLTGPSAAPQLVGHEAQITSAAFNGDGTAIVTASQDSTARLWDARTGRQRAVLSGHDWHVLDAGFSPDGKRVVTASADQTARLWNATTGAFIGVLGGHQGSVTSARFNTAGNLVVTTSWDGFVRLFDVATLELQQVVKHPNGNLVAASLNSAGDRLATSSSEGEAQLWAIEAGKEPKQIATVPGNARSMSFSPDGRWLAVHNWHGHLTVHDAATGASAATFSNEKLNVHAYAFSPGSRSLAAITQSGVRYTWPLLATTQEALDYAKSIAPNCLTADERTLMGLDAAIPAWCTTIKPRGAALPR